jgi:hypothetical protein
MLMVGALIDTPELLAVVVAEDDFPRVSITAAAAPAPAAIAARIIHFLLTLWLRSPAPVITTLGSVPPVREALEACAGAICFRLTVVMDTCGGSIVGAAAAGNCGVARGF